MYTGFVGESNARCMKGHLIDERGLRRVDDGGRHYCLLCRGAYHTALGLVMPDPDDRSAKAIPEQVVRAARKKRQMRGVTTYREAQRTQDWVDQIINRRLDEVFGEYDQRAV
jgi:hypothetical protein